MTDVLRGQRFGTLEDAGVIGGEVASSSGVDEPSTWLASCPGSTAAIAPGRSSSSTCPWPDITYVTPEPGPFDGEGTLSDYRNALRYGDASIGTLLDGLRTRGLERETLFVIWKYLLEIEARRSSPFDVCRDPGETRDQAAGQEGRVQIYFERTTRWLAATRESYTGASVQTSRSDVRRPTETVRSRGGPAASRPGG